MTYYDRELRHHPRHHCLVSSKGIPATLPRGYRFTRAFLTGAIVGLVIDVCLLFLSGGAFLIISVIIGVVTGVFAYAHPDRNDLALTVAEGTIITFTLQEQTPVEVLQ